MAKFFETPEDTLELVEKKFEETGYANIISLKVMSIAKAKEILKVKKGSPETNFVAKNRADVCLIIYQDAFDRLGDEQKETMLEGIFSNITYDYDKDKILVDSSRYGEAIRMAKKYNNYLDTLELGYLTIEQMAEEEKERKAQEKEAKKNK